MENRTSTSSAHTAGPWDYQRQNEFGLELFDVYPANGGIRVAEVEGAANARLIAKAWLIPELVAAAKDAFTALDVAAKRDPDQAGLYHCPRLRNAVAKAECA